jgi:hypothetical protein
MTKIHDHPGGCSAAHRPAAGPAAAQRPGARRPASLGALPVDAAPEALRGLGRAPRPADDAAPGPAGSSRRVQWRTAPPVPRGLPPRSLETIAPIAPIDPRIGAVGAGPHPGLRRSPAGCSISDEAVARGRDLEHLEPLRAVLQDVQSLPPERPDLRARPLAVLAGRIGALHGTDDRRPAFDAILETIMQAPGGQRRLMDAPLMMLAAQVAVLDPAERAGALQRLLQAQQPPGSLAGGLHLLAGRLEDLPHAVRPQAPAQVLQWAERLEPGPARELAGHLSELPEAAQAPALSGLLQACSSYAPGQRSERLQDLARGSRWLSGPVHVQAVQGVLAAAEPLAPQQRWAVLQPLCEQVHRLPEAEQASTWQAVVHSYLAVPPGQLAAALAQLHARIRTLLQAGDERQLAVPLMPAVLQELPAWPQLGTLPPEERKKTLLLCAQVLDEMPQADPQGLLEQARHSIPPLQEEHRGPSSSRQVRSRTEPADRLTELPPAVHETIAARMGPEDRTMLARSNRTLRASLRGFSTSDRVVAQGRGVDYLEQLTAALQEVQSLPLGQTDLRARPLAVLAARLGHLLDGEDDEDGEDHEDASQSAFDAILATILQTPAGQRRPMDVPLMMLATQVGHLDTAEQQTGALQRLLQAQEPPGSLAAGLHLLAGRLEDLPQAARQQASMQVREWARRLEPAPARELADTVQSLPDKALEPALSGLLQAAGSVAPEQRTQRLMDLASHLGGLPGPLHLQMLHGVRAAAESLAPQQRRDVLERLCADVYLLPQAEHASAWQALVHSYLAVLPGQLDAAIVQLHALVRSRQNAPAGQQLAVPWMPAVLLESLAWLRRSEALAEAPGEAIPPQARSRMLRHCAANLAGLPEAERQPFFQLALRSIPLLRQEDRSPLLEALAKAIAALPEAARQPQWQNTLQAVEPLPPGQGVLVLAPLAAQIHKLPMEARAAAFESLRQALRGRDEQYRGSSVQVLGHACRALPREQWPRVLGQVLAESERIPDLEHRAHVLVGLAENFCWAEPAADGPSHPRNDDRLWHLQQVMRQMLRLPLAPARLGDFVRHMKFRVRSQERIRPHDAAFVAAVVEHLRRIEDHLTAAGAGGHPQA